ncbi:hypothetical protein FBU30_002113, partial [Linnemannia zychae]
MENSPSGLVTPPLVSPRPIQSQKQSDGSSNNWKVVGSPPRRPLLSPPEERERQRTLHEADITTVEANNTTRTAVVTLAAADTADLTDSTPSSMSASTSTEASLSSSASSTSNPASPTMPQYKHGTPRIHTGKEMSNTNYQLPSGPPNIQQSSFYSIGGPLSPFASDPFAENLPLQSTHFKSSSTGSLGNSALDSLTFHNFLDEQGLSSSLSTHNLGREAGMKRSSLNHNSNALESSLAMSSFAWDSQVSREPSASTISSRTNNRASVTVDNFSGLGSPLDGRSSSYYSLHLQTSRLTDESDTGVPKTIRSMSFSEPSFPNAFGLGTAKSGYDQDDEDVLRYRPPLATMDEELEDPIDAPRMARTRSFSTSAALSSSAFPGGLSTSLFSPPTTQDPFGISTGPVSGSALAMEDDIIPQLNRRLSGAGAAWPNSAGPDSFSLNHRRSMTSTSSYNAPIWESSGLFQPLSPSVERDRHQDRQLIARRFSVAPSSGLQNYDAFLDEAESSSPSTLGGFNRFLHENDPIQQSPRRHSVAAPSGSYLRTKTGLFDLSSSLEGLRLDENERNTNHGWGANEGLVEEDECQGDIESKDLGKGLSLGQLPHRGSLYMVEFKAGRNDLFYTSENSGLNLKKGDLVMVEADRGKDLGKIINDSITPQQILALQTQQAESAALQAQQDGGNGGQRAPKEIHPKRIFGLAQPSEIAQLISKNQDEIEAMIMCQTKVRQKRLPMEVVNAEYQWDRRKLTFYFTAERRIDFRELVRDLFKMYKTRIWMYALSP